MLVVRGKERTSVPLTEVGEPPSYFLETVVRKREEAIPVCSGFHRVVLEEH
jgi:hypothetical protein